MPKFGFKQVVEQAQESVLDQNKRFADDILSASRAMRIIEPKAQRREREGTLATMATSFNMSLLSSSASLGMANIATSNHLQSRSRSRRPPSMQSEASQLPLAAPVPLYAIIAHHASNPSSELHVAKFLPHENEVLSALLVPFIAPRRSEAADSERLQALEVFETTVKTWQAASDEDFLGRCLWCCKVARIIQDQRELRMRVLGDLFTCLLSSGDPSKTGSVTILQALFQFLFSLHGSLLAEGDSEGASYVLKLINGVKKTGCEGLNASSVMQQYGDHICSEADAQAVLDCLIVMALAACMENALDGERRYMLNNMMAVKDDWFSAAGSSHHLPNLVRIETLCLTRCTRALLNFLHPTDGPRPSAEDCYLVFKILTEWSIPAARSLVPEGSFDCKVMSARLAISILCLSGKGIGEAINSVIENWYRDSGQWKAALEAAIQIVIKDNNWESVVAILLALMDQLPYELCSAAAAQFLPALNERLVLDPPPFPFLALTELLGILSQKLPKLFYKPLFACAAGSKTSSLLNHLRTIAIVARYLPSFWIRDTEMLLVALMSDSGNIERGSQDKVGLPWGQARLGQLVVLIELIAQVQATRQEKDGRGPSSSTFSAHARFFFDLEHRLGAFIEKKERMLLIPVAQRIFLVILFLEIRLLVCSLKPAQWLSPVISWVLSSEEDLQVPQNDTALILESLTEIYSAIQQWSLVSQKRTSASILSPSKSVHGVSSGSGTPLTAHPVVLIFSTREQLLNNFSKGLIINSLRLFVAVSGLFSKEDHESLCGFLWQCCLTQAPYDIQTLATFLIMQCAENAPTAILGLIRTDIRSPQASRRLLAGHRLSLLAGWRFQMLSQNYIVDKNHRRPFKLPRVPVSFLPTDIGSSSFVLREDLANGNSGGQALALEIRKRLADIGWTQDESAMDQKQERIMTPFSLISGQQLEKVEGGLPTTMVTRSPQTGTLERPPSSAGEHTASGRGVKRRPIFVPPLVSILPELASLAYDDDYGVANAARVAVMDWMRHDPALITRPALDALSARETSLNSAFSLFRSYLYAQSTLPPAMAHYMFNHLTGFLRFSSREAEGEDAPTGFAYTVPLLSKLVTQVSDMSLRELRRAKIDIFLVPSGSLWFPSSAPEGSMFPRSLSDIKGSSSKDAVHRLGDVILVRVAQNLLVANMLKRDRQEIQSFRKNMPRLVLPTISSTITLSTEPRSFLPSKTSSRAGGADTDTLGLSLLLSRSYVLLVTEIFRSLPRHLNDRSELAVLIDGLNQILFVHGEDIGIVAHVLIALMTASARFHRLFTSGASYTLFIPALFMVYAESESNEGVRRAIEYSVNRFYAVHREAFVFQTLNMLSHIVMVPEVDGPWIAKQIFLLLSTLKDDTPIHAPDAAGIHGSNKAQEREALMIRTADEKPQAFLALLRKNSGSQGEDVGVAVPEQYDSSRLSLDNFVRLLLTVIGHDPTIRRAEQFLRLLRFMAPHFYDASPQAQSVLLEGINALSLIFIGRSTGKTKVTENSRIRAEESIDSFSQAAGASIDAVEAARSPSNFTEMKFDYLSLVTEFSKSGGSFGLQALRRIFDLTKTILRGSDPKDGERAASFLGSFAHAVLLRNTSDIQLKQVLTVLSELGPIFKAHVGTVDFSKMLEVVIRLVENPVYANQPSFSLIVVPHFCTAGLEALDRLASDGSTFSNPFRAVFVRLLCRATLLTGTDVVSLIEHRPITFEFVAGVLYPMALNLPSTAEIASDTRWMEAWRKAAIRRMWICLLQQAMQACRGQWLARTSDKTEKLPPLERKRSHEKKGNVVKNYPAATLSVALQTLKIIVLKAEDELSSSLPNIWVQMGLLLKNVLSAGNARFAKPDQFASVTSSPRQPSTSLKPRTSEDSDLLTPLSPRIASPRAHSPRPFLIDYLLWSMLDFVCRHRSPLMIQLRLFLQEATATVDRELHAQETPATRSRRFSYTSVFAKTPQRQRSGHRSKGPSPEASPFLTPLRLHQGDVLLTPPKPERQPGYARSPVTTGDSEGVGPRIVHLGPVQNFDMFRRSPSPGPGESDTKSRKWLQANSITITSAKLVLGTYRRVRAVQRFMGYTDLLPVPDEAEGSVDDVRVWSRGTALNETEGETTDLMEEFWSQDEE